jgi:hypothetical protein
MLFIARVCALILLAGNVVASFVTDSTGTVSWLVVPVVGVVGPMATALVQPYRPPTPVDGSRTCRADTPGGGTPLPVVLIVAVVVFGLGGSALTQGIRFAVGDVTGNEPGTDRLRERVTATGGGLTLSVRSVEPTRHYTHVEVRARNASGVTVTLRLFNNCFFVGRRRQDARGDSFRSR